MSDALTLAEAARLMAARQLSPVELTETMLARIARLNSSFNAFVNVTAERAMADARGSERRLASGTSRGPLDGIPVGHKDIFATAGIETTGGSRILQGWVPDRDAGAVARLRDAGTVHLGKLTTYEFAMGGPSFDLPWPPALNPWNVDHMTAGSSSGSAAAVAANLVLGATGSDTAGSVRVPAAHCGVAGIKPTYGLISRAGCLPLSQSLDHAGVFGWTVEDCALMLEGTAGHDPEDPTSADRPSVPYAQRLGGGVRGLRIGIIDNFHEVDNPAEESVQRAIAGAADIFRKGGATVKSVRLPTLQDYNAVSTLILTVEGHAVHQKRLQQRYTEYGVMIRSRISIGGLISGVDYMQAVRRRRDLCSITAAAMADVDILLTTGSPGEALPLKSDQKLRNLDRPPFTAPFNVTGQPAISVPAGLGPRGLPVSIQLAARPFEEEALLRAAHFYETEAGHRSIRPAAAA